MKIAVLTLGCRTNQAESIHIEKTLSESGYQIATKNIEDADIFIINTCAVTAKAEQQSRQLIHKYLKSKAKIIVTGCYSQYYPEKVRAIDSNIIILKNDDKDNVLKIIPPLKTDKDEVFKRNFIPQRHRPTVKIQDGCNNACSYCLIPLIRGASRSIQPQKIIEEVITYEILGFKEVVLTGIHIGSYGYDLEPQSSLSNLLNLILKKTSKLRIRLSSIESTEIEDELLDLVTDKRICKHFHIPLQSGDDKILERMNRHYTRKSYIKKIEKILYLFGDIGLGTDIIVGFPGEDDKAFKNTENLVKEVPFSYLHVFSFSLRPGTKAADFQPKVDENVKKIRSQIIKTLGEEKKRLYILKNIGKIKSVIIEGESLGGFYGTSEDYIKVLLPKDKDIRAGVEAIVRIEKYSDGLAIGKSLNAT